MHYGDAVKGEISTDGATGGVAVTLYPSGSTTARTLQSNEFLTITDIVFVSTAGGAYALVADTDVAGLRIVKGDAEVLGGLVVNFTRPITCPKGVTPKLFADTGQVDLTISGYITQV